jgi:hypothetical protein
MNNTSLTAREFSDFYKIPRSTVLMWCRNGFLEGAFRENTPFGDIWYIPKETVDRFSGKPRRGRPKFQGPLEPA